MAINAGKAEVTVVGKFKDDITSKSKKAFDKLKAGAKAAFKAAAVAVAAFTAGMVKAISLANEQELAIARVEGALRATGAYSKEFSEELQTMASGFQEVSTTGDESILAMQSLLIAMGATRENIKQVTQATLDLSAGMGVNAKGAALLFGKALSGDFGTLSRYGILVTDVEGNANKLASALKQVQDKFGGAAQVQAETFGGKLTQISNAFGDMLEEIGFVITKEKEFSDMLTVIKEKFKEWSTTIKANRVLLQALARDIVGGVKTSFNVLFGAARQAAKAFGLLAFSFQDARARWSKFVESFQANRMANLQKTLADIAKHGDVNSEVYKRLSKEAEAYALVMEKQKDKTDALNMSAQRWIKLAVEGGTGAVVDFTGNLRKSEEALTDMAETYKEAAETIKGIKLVDPHDLDVWTIMEDKLSADFKKMEEDKKRIAAIKIDMGFGPDDAEMLDIIDAKNDAMFTKMEEDAKRIAAIEIDWGPGLDDIANMDMMDASRDRMFAKAFAEEERKHQAGKRLIEMEIAKTQHGDIALAQLMDSLAIENGLTEMRLKGFEAEAKRIELITKFEKSAGRKLRQSELDDLSCLVV